MFLDGFGQIDGIRLDALRDNMNNSTTGYSFVTELGNKLASGRERILRRLLYAPVRTGLIRSSSRGFEVDSRMWMAYENRLKEFRGLLAVLMHISGGPPARGSEILSIRHVNAPQNMRNIFILDGQVIFVTAYHKSQALTGKHKVITRFLPATLGKMLVAFLSEVLPFVRLLEKGVTAVGMRSFLWADKGGLWGTSRITDVLARETSLRLGMRVTMQAYRHLAIAIDRQHVRGLMMDTMEEQQADHAHDLGASHSSHTAELSYAIDASMLRGMSAMTVMAFREVAQRWHRFLDLDSGNGSGSDRRLTVVKRPRTPSQNWDLPERKHLRSMSNESRLSLVDKKLGDLLGVGARFRSDEQREAILTILVGDGPLVVVLPTGGGKSLIFQLPAALSTLGVTVVVVPFRALAANLVDRCMKLGIDSVHWTSDQSRQAQLIVVVIDTAIKNEFIGLLSTLRLNGRLDRIVLDECHVILLSHEFRPNLSKIEELRKIPCQFVLLTGTLPPWMQSELETCLLLGNRDNGLRYIRSSSNRPTIRYEVQCYSDNVLLFKFKDLILTARRDMRPTERILIFSVSREECEILAKLLNCQPYHSEWADKEDSLHQWMDGEMTILVATSAVGTGIDVSGISLVIHYGPPYTLTDFYQEVGRGGRSGERMKSLIVLKSQKLQWFQKNLNNSDFAEKRDVWRFLTTVECRRKFLTDYFDGVGQMCYQNNNEFCDNCIKSFEKRSEFEQFQKEEEERWKISPHLY
jgi:superfamily II DNA/RNA helicase